MKSDYMKKHDKIGMKSIVRRCVKKEAAQRSLYGATIRGFNF